MMQGMIQHFVILAADEKSFRVWGRFDDGKEAFGTEHWVTLIGVTAFMLLVAMAWRILARRSARTFTAESVPRLFRELCAAHGLNRSSRRLLQNLAAARGVANAAMLFIEPQHFEAKSLPPELKSSAARLRQLRGKLFG